MNVRTRFDQLKWGVGCVALLVALAGCGGDDEESPAGAGGSSGESGEGGTSGDSGEGGDSGDSGGPTECDVDIVEDDTCTNSGEDNISCTTADTLMPFTGACAPKGDTCHRASNRAKECQLGPDEPMVMEMRVAQSLTDNMPNSSGIPAIAMSALNRSKLCSSEQCLLFRSTIPRENGERVAGEGTTEIAVGRYNCDGTYSFYSDTAAPDRSADIDVGGDEGRWAVRVADTSFDPSKEGREQSEVINRNPNRDLSCNAFYVDNSTDIDWELCTRGFDILEIDTSVEARDGFGSYDGMNWTRPGKYEVYAPIDVNDKDIINALGITFCQLMAFGPLGPDFRGSITCSGTERCLPLDPIPDAQADRTCPYVKLPDSLCPTDEQADMFGCHLGSVENVNNEAGYPEVDCTDEEPTEPLPDGQGQCCDPLGQSNDLPACNAFRIVNTYAATAVEITDDPKSDLQPVCE